MPYHLATPAIDSDYITTDMLYLLRSPLPVENFSNGSKGCIQKDTPGMQKSANHLFEVTGKFPYSRRISGCHRSTHKE